MRNFIDKKASLDTNEGTENCTQMATIRRGEGGYFSTPANAHLPPSKERTTEVDSKRQKAERLFAVGKCKELWQAIPGARCNEVTEV